MSHTRKDTRVSSPEWWKHLRPFNKRRVSKAERRAAVDEIADEMTNDDVPLRGLGLHNDLKAMVRLKAEKGASVVPRGMYCYDENGNCPYWDKAANAPKQQDGFCWFMGKGDLDVDVDLLWDSCKGCGLNDSDVPEWTLEVGE